MPFEDHLFWKNSFQFIAGVDEVGRGPLAGPVVSCCCFMKWSESMSKKKWLKHTSCLEDIGIRDSKKLSPLQRQKTLKLLGIEVGKLKLNQKFVIIQKGPVEIAATLALASAREIDQLNIHRASLLAMKRAFNKSHLVTKGMLLVDGRFGLALEERVEQQALIKGDGRSLFIALASIIAKEYRDEKMRKFAKKYPHYGLELNSGYPTAYHRQALKKWGPSPIHRLSYGPIREEITN